MGDSPIEFVGGAALIDEAARGRPPEPSSLDARPRRKGVQYIPAARNVKEIFGRPSLSKKSAASPFL
jgi:hypothetical protein